MVSRAAADNPPGTATALGAAAASVAGGGSGAAGAGPTVFVTVGTTKFDALIRAVDNPALVAALAARGYRRLVVQVGAGGYTPSRLVPPVAGDVDGATAVLSLPSVGAGAGEFSVEWFRFAPSLAAHMTAAALVISHAGAGSLFEALRLGNIVIAVPNDILMDNHQAELAEHLAGLGHLVASRAEDLVQTVQTMRPETLTPYPAGDASGIVRVLDRLMGLTPE